MVCEECGLRGYGWHCGFCVGERGFLDELRAAELQLAAEGDQEPDLPALVDPRTWPKGTRVRRGSVNPPGLVAGPLASSSAL